MGLYIGFFIAAAVTIIGIGAQLFLYYSWRKDMRWWKIAAILLIFLAEMVLLFVNALVLTVLFP